MLELYQQPEALPQGNTYGKDFFARGTAFKVEVAPDYRRFEVKPKFVYGRDWPLVKMDKVESADWLYKDTFPTGLKAVVFSSAFPYFNRVVLWFGYRPIVFHFEWVPLMLVTSGYGLYRLRKRIQKRYRVYGIMFLIVLLAAYFLLVTGLWYSRYTL